MFSSDPNIDTNLDHCNPGGLPQRLQVIRVMAHPRTIKDVQVFHSWCFALNKIATIVTTSDICIIYRMYTRDSRLSSIREMQKLKYNAPIDPEILNFYNFTR